MRSGTDRAVRCLFNCGRGWRAFFIEFQCLLKCLHLIFSIEPPMSGLAKAIGKEGVALRKMRSWSLAVGSESVLIPIDWMICVLLKLIITVLFDWTRKCLINPSKDVVAKSSWGFCETWKMLLLFGRVLCRETNERGRPVKDYGNFGGVSIQGEQA